MKKKIAFHTLGCKLNFSETSGIARQFREDDYEQVDFQHEADIYVINTCSVTGTAEKKCRQAIRQARKRNPEASIAVVGCFSQLRPAEVASLEGVDVILGSNTKFDLFNIIETRSREGRRAQEIHIDEKAKQFSETEDTKPGGTSSNTFTPSYSSGDRTRSFFKIQDGCDYFCSYCTIPFARGLSRSASIDQVIEMAGEIVGLGIREIILTGVNVGDFGSKEGSSLFGLMKALETVKDIGRIRISSIEPELLTDEMIEWSAKSKHFLPHFHIPLQSGSDKILKLMKRHYQTAVFRSRVLKIKEVMPHACIAADVIVGFPGETEEDFMDTYRFIEDLPLSYCHVFTYSERPGTLSVKLDDKVQDSLKTDRSMRLHRLSERKKEVFYQSVKGSQQAVLFESDNDKGMIYGFTDNYIKVKTAYDTKLVNEIRDVTLENLESDLTYRM
ncbi:MAG: tRNA (N(6)-L-threonylcarbamoyladenosine(37)-C(2))-methylthiotransferase MtaB [Bacteroidota bacterium]